MIIIIIIIIIIITEQVDNCCILDVGGKIMIINHFNHQVWGARHPRELDARTNASAGLKLFTIMHL